MLINVPDDACSKSAINSTNRMLKAAKSRHVMLDSGGYQLHVAENESKKYSSNENRPAIRNETEVNLDPIHVMKAAAILKPDIVTGLDFPIKKISDPEEREMEFMHKLGFNVIWARKCSELRKKLCPDVQFFLPVQCYDLIQFDQFINLIPGVEYDGFSMPVRNLSISQIILFMIRFYQMGIRQVHILGTSELFKIAVAAYMARHFFEWVSFDATTWRVWAQCALYMNPYNLLQERIAQNVIIDENIAMDCICPFCRDKTFTSIKNMPETDRTAFLRCHNWWVIEKASRDLYQNSGNVIELERCLRARAAKPEDVKELRKALSLADAFKIGDIRILQDRLK
jgi:queuine/archaeosine tRNA-ribosyltransferase